MRDHADLIIGALDLLLLFLILGFLALMAIKYDAEKGLGKEEYVRIYNLLPKDKDLLADKQSQRFQAIVLDSTSLKLYRFDEGQPKIVGTFRSAQQLFASGKLDLALPCILHEKDKSPAFAEIIRNLINSQVQIGIAQILRKDTDAQSRRPS
jgi:hypothetical protein